MNFKLKNPHRFARFAHVEVKGQNFIEKISKEEKINKQKLERMIGRYLYSEKIPLGDEIIKLLPQKPRLLERKLIIKRIREKLRSFVEIFVEW